MTSDSTKDYDDVRERIIRETAAKLAENGHLDATIEDVDITVDWSAPCDERTRYPTTGFHDTRTDPADDLGLYAAYAKSFDPALAKYHPVASTGTPLSEAAWMTEDTDDADSDDDDALSPGEAMEELSADFSFPDHSLTDDEIAKFKDSISTMDVSGISLDDETSAEMKALASGLSPPTAKELAHLHEASEKLEESMTETISSLPTPSLGTDADMSMPSPEEFDAFEMDVDTEMADAILKRLYTELDAARHSGYDPKTVVLGLPQYKVLYPWAQATHGTCLEDVLTVKSVIVVPGPMIHVHTSNRELLTEHLSEESEADDGE